MKNTRDAIDTESLEANIDESVIYNFGDIILFQGDEYYVIKNFGDYGTVCPVCDNYYIENFLWSYHLYGTPKSKFVRKATEKEIEKLGLI